MRTNFLATVLAFFLIVGCNGEDELGVAPDDLSPAGFPADVKRILDNNCVACHGAQTAEAGLRLDSWANLITGSDFGEAVIPFDSENSLMIEMLTKLVGGPHPAEQNANTLQSGEVDALTSWIDEGAKNNSGEVPYENSVNRIYVCAQAAGIVSVIDADARVVIRNVRVGDFELLPILKPHHVAVTPDGQGWFVSLIGADRVLKFTANYEKAGESPTITVPALLATHPSEDLLYVSRFMDFQNPLSSIFVLDSQTMQPAANTAEGEIPVFFSIPHSMAIDNAGNFVYTASLSESQLIVINTQSNEVEEFISLGQSKGPLQLAVSPDDRSLYVSGQISDEMLVVDISNPASRALIDSISVGDQPWHLAFTPDGGRVYVTNFASDEVSVINTASRTVETTIVHNGLSQPHGIVASKNTAFVYVSSRNTTGSYAPRYDLGDNAFVGTVTVINTATNTIEKVLEIEEFGSGMAIWEQ